MIDLRVGDCVDVMRDLPSGSVDLVVTSPPYDNLRKYEGFAFNLPATSAQLLRVVRPGGVVVWIVGDATIDGSETGTSFRTALHFLDAGFLLHDTMIWDKDSLTTPGVASVRYGQVFEYMFIFSKGRPATFNPICDKPNRTVGQRARHTQRGASGKLGNVKVSTTPAQSPRYNVWRCPPARQRGRGAHPAPFPVQLAADHIRTWSNEGDLVLDPFCGSGSTGVAARALRRSFMGIDVSSKYVELARGRIHSELSPTRQFDADAQLVPPGLFPLDGRKP